MSNTLKIGELVAPPVENTLADAKTVPLPGIPASTAPPPAPEAPPPPPEAPAPAPGPAAPPEEPRPGPSAELREFIAMLRRDRRNQVQIRRLKRTVWAVAAAATIIYFTHRSRSDGPQPAAETDPPPPTAFQAPPEPEPVAPAAPPAPFAVATDELRTPAGQLENTAGCEESFSRQRWRTAVDTCTKVFEESPGPEVALRIAHAHWARGQADQAGFWARKALRLGNRDADAFVLIGHSEREAGHGNRAAAAYRRYLQSSPRGWHARRLRAAIRELRRRTAYGQPSAQRSDHVIR